MLPLAKKQPADRRDRMAIAAAPFCHARLVYAEIKRPSAMSETELDRAIAIAEERRKPPRHRSVV